MYGLLKPCFFRTPKEEEGQETLTPAAMTRALSLDHLQGHPCNLTMKDRQCNGQGPLEAARPSKRPVPTSPVAHTPPPWEGQTQRLHQAPLRGGPQQMAQDPGLSESPQARLFYTVPPPERRSSLQSRADCAPFWSQGVTASWLISIPSTGTPTHPQCVASTEHTHLLHKHPLHD